MCILTYVGRGYTASFVRNLDNVIARLQSGSEVVLVDGPDDICAAFDHEDRHCERASVRDRDRAAVQALRGRLGVHSGEPFALSAVELEWMRGDYLKNREQTCGGCEWHALCGSIASGGFADAKLTFS